MSNTDTFHIWDFNGAGNPEGKSKGKLNLRFSGSQLDLKLRPQVLSWSLTREWDKSTSGCSFTALASVLNQRWHRAWRVRAQHSLQGLRDAKYAASAQPPCPGFVSAFFFPSLEAGSQYMVHMGSDIRPTASAFQVLGL